MKKQESAIHLVLSLAKHCKEHKTHWCGGFHVDKLILEFCQSKKVTTYREMRKLLSMQSQFKKSQNEFIKLLEEKLKQKFVNWSLSHWEDDRHNETPEFIPQSIGKDGTIISHEEEVQEVLNKNTELYEKNQNLKKSLSEFSKQTVFIYEWIDKLFVLGILEAEIEDFLKKKENRKTKTRINRRLVENLINPEITNVVEEQGEPPSLSVSERQTIQFLSWKSENMNEVEMRLKSLLLGGKNENAKRDGVCVCFEETEAIINNYGPANPAGYHYNELKFSLKSLSEKNRKLILRNDMEEIKISIPLIKKVQLEHRFQSDPEFKRYIAVHLDQAVLELGDKYTSYPKDHFALLRHTPPKTKFADEEVKFFDMLLNEISYDSSKSNTIKRKKIKFLQSLDTDGSFTQNNHLPRLAEKVENKYVSKALNLGYLANFRIEHNKDGEEVYVFKINAKDKIPHLKE